MSASEAAIARANAERGGALIGYLPVGFPTLPRASRQPSRSPRTASTSSNSACRTPTRSWTVRSSRRRRRPHWRTASGCTTGSTRSARSPRACRPGCSDDLLEPGHAVRRRSFRRRARGCRRSWAHHPRPRAATKQPTGSPHPSAPVSTECSSRRRRRPTRVSFVRSKRAPGLCTPSPRWESRAHVPTSTPQPGRSWHVCAKLAPPAPASVSASRPPNRSARSSPTPTVRSSVQRSSVLCRPVGWMLSRRPQRHSRPVLLLSRSPER